MLRNFRPESQGVEPGGAAGLSLFTRSPWPPRACARETREGTRCFQYQRAIHIIILVRLSETVVHLRCTGLHSV